MSQWIAGLHTSCDVCRESIVSGDEMYPHFLDEIKRKYRWAHLRCLSAPTPPLCKHWKFLGRCSLGPACFFSHACAPAPVKRGRKLLKTGRAFAFRRWLLEKFPGVKSAADVAGGKGELAFELKNLNGWEVAVFDPRAGLELSQCFKKWELGLFTRNRHWRQLSPDYDASRTPEPPRHFQVLFTPQLCGWLDAPPDAPAWEKFLEESADSQYWDLPEHIEQAEEAEAAQPSPPPGASEVLDFLRSCEILIGLHADGATEELVDFALKQGKGFAVVPCCVFAKKFPGRRLLSGGTVTSPAEFVQYLCEKDRRIQTDTLEFEGRNTVVYFNPGAPAPAPILAAGLSRWIAS